MKSTEFIFLYKDWIWPITMVTLQISDSLRYFNSYFLFIDSILKPAKVFSATAVCHVRQGLGRRQFSSRHSVVMGRKGMIWISSKKLLPVFTGMLYFVEATLILLFKEHFTLCLRASRCWYTTMVPTWEKGIRAIGFKTGKIFSGFCLSALLSLLHNCRHLLLLSFHCVWLGK